MIKDNIKNAHNYFNISERLKAGLEWIKTNDLLNMPEGRYLINGESLYANLQSYETKEDALFEAHRKYIDIQYMVRGKEKVGITDYDNCISVEGYNEEKDIEFLNNKKEEWYETINEGEFLILFPNDAHKPSISPDFKTNVKKVVVKVLI